MIGCGAVRHDVSRDSSVRLQRLQYSLCNYLTNHCYNSTLLYSTQLYSLDALSLSSALSITSFPGTHLSSLFSLLSTTLFCHSLLPLCSLPSISLSIHLSVCLSVYLSICPVRELIPYRSVVYRITHLDLSVRPSIHPTIYPCIHPLLLPFAHPSSHASSHTQTHLASILISSYIILTRRWTTLRYFIHPCVNKLLLLVIL